MSNLETPDFMFLKVPGNNGKEMVQANLYYEDNDTLYVGVGKNRYTALMDLARSFNSDNENDKFMVF